MIYRIEVDLDGGGEVRVTAHDRETGNQVGSLTVFGGDGDGFMLETVHVEPEYRRKGIATYMLMYANRVVPVHFDESYQDDSIMKWSSKR